MEYVFTKQNFTAEVLQSDIPVVVDFYAEWCGPCKMMAPILREFAGKTDGKLKVGKLNIDNDVELAHQYRVMSVPTLLIFSGGELKGKFSGAMPLKELESRVEEILK